MALKFQGGKAAAARKYKLGDMWSSDFDYDGMLAYLRKAMAGKLTIPQMELLYDSMEDVNYHTENRKLRAKIDEMKGKPAAKPGMDDSLVERIEKIVNDSLLQTMPLRAKLEQAQKAANSAKLLISNSAADDADEAMKLYAQANSLLLKADSALVRAFTRGTNLPGA